MIKLIKNELKKIGLLKILFSYLLCILIILLLYKINNKGFIYTSYTLIEFIPIIVIIIFSPTISNEINNGTFKIYLTKPIKRYKILLSKYITEIIYSIVLVFVIITTYSILNNKIDYHFIKNILILSYPILLTCSITIFLSLIIKNNSVNVGIQFVIITLSQMITNIFLSLNKKYILFSFIPYYDLNNFINRNYLVLNVKYGLELNIQKSFIIITIYTILIYIITNLLFIKKDIKN